MWCVGGRRGGEGGGGDSLRSDGVHGCGEGVWGVLLQPPVKPSMKPHVQKRKNCSQLSPWR